MIIESTPQYLGELTVDDIAAIKQRELSLYSGNGFKWDSKYLPIIVAGMGISAVVLIAQLRKKKRRGK